MKISTLRCFRWLCLTALSLILAACRSAASTPTTIAETKAATNTTAPTSFNFPTLLPTLTPILRTTQTLPPTPTPSPTLAMRTLTPTSKREENETTPTIDALELYEKASEMCQSAFTLTSTITATIPDTSIFGTYLPTFPLINLTYESSYWQPLPSLEWIEAKKVSELRSLTCVRADRREDAIYGDESPGYTLRWHVRLLSWPTGLPFAEEIFWGEGPPIQKSTTGDQYGQPPVEALLSWTLCDLANNLDESSKSSFCHSQGPLTVSPNGKWLAAGKDVWNLANRQQQTVYAGHQGNILSLAFSPDGSSIASSAVEERNIHLWEAKSGESKHILRGHRGEITGLAFSPNGQWLLSISQDGSLRLWDAIRGEMHLIVAKNLGWLHSLAISPDGNLVAAGTWGQPGLIYIWNLPNILRGKDTGEALHTIEASKLHINSLSFSPDSRLLASGGLDSTIKLWDMTNALKIDGAIRLVASLQEHKDSVTSLAFSPDGKSLASGSLDRMIIIWNTNTGISQQTLSQAFAAVSSVAYTPDGKWIAASSGGLVKLFELPE